MRFDESRGVYIVEIDRVIDGKRMRKTRRMPKGATEAEALAVEQRMMGALLHTLKTERDGGWVAYVDSLVARRSWLDEALAKCVYRAKQKAGHRCTLTREHIADVMYFSNGRCQVTGIAFSDTPIPGHEVRPFRHSIDRIDSKRGYSRDNIRIVCAGVNIAMMHWGEDVFGQMAVGYVLHKYAFISQISAANVPNGPNHKR